MFGCSGDASAGELPSWKDRRLDDKLWKAPARDAMSKEAEAEREAFRPLVSFFRSYTAQQMFGCSGDASAGELPSWKDRRLDDKLWKAPARDAMSKEAEAEREAWLSHWDIGNQDKDWHDLVLQKDEVPAMEGEDETLVDAMIAARWRGTRVLASDHGAVGVGLWKDMREDVEHKQRLRKDGWSLARKEDCKNLKEANKNMVNGDGRTAMEKKGREKTVDFMLAEKERELRDALELAETAQRESNSLRLALQRAQEEAATLRLCVRFAETASIRGAAGAGTGSCAETVRQRISSTFRAQEAQRKAEAWEAEAGTLRREVARLGDKLADAEREGCEQRERAEQEQARARKLREINLGLEQLLEAVEAPSLRETKLSALLAVLRGDILKLNKELQVILPGPRSSFSLGHCGAEPEDVKAVAGQWDRTPGLYHSQLHHPRALPSEPRSESLGPPHSALSRSSQIRLETQSRLLESFRRNLQHLD